jgi:hypothetical protein
MLDTVSPTKLRATLIGPVAARSLREASRGTVAAVFDRSFYVSLGGMPICLGPHALGAGPLNVLCDSPVSLGEVGLHVGDPVCVVAGVLRISTVHIDFSHAAPWQPEPPGAWTTASLERGLSALAAALPAALPEQGLAQLLRPAEARGRSPVLAVALAPARYLDATIEQWISGAGPEVERAQFAPLIGLGTGLTPSGDDYVGGILVALALTSRTALRDCLWQTLEPVLAANTGDVSRAHLNAAAEGLCSAALHKLLNAVLEGDTGAIPRALTAVAAIGHTSGWDALAGAASVLQRTNR